MVAFIEENRQEFGVEPIRGALQVAPSTYYAARSRPPSRRARRDAVLAPQLAALWRANYSVYGAHKLRGGGPPGGIVDAFSRRIVGWRVAAHMRTRMVLDALEMARASRGTHLGGLVAHSDAGSQPASLRWGQRLAELGAAPSVGSVGDSYDNALAETAGGIYETELIRGPTGGPRRTVGDVELATLAWVHWHNHQRLHGHLGDLPPTEFEAAYAARQTDREPVGNQ